MEGGEDDAVVTEVGAGELCERARPARPAQQPRLQGAAKDQLLGDRPEREREQCGGEIGTARGAGRSRPPRRAQAASGGAEAQTARNAGAAAPPARCAGHTAFRACCTPGRQAAAPFAPARSGRPPPAPASAGRRAAPRSWCRTGCRARSDRRRVGLVEQVEGEVEALGRRRDDGHHVRRDDVIAEPLVQVGEQAIGFVDAAGGGVRAGQAREAARMVGQQRAQRAWMATRARPRPVVSASRPARPLALRLSGAMSSIASISVERRRSGPGAGAG